LEEISDASQLDISTRTTGNTLREEGYFSFVAEKEEELKPEHKTTRVEWCEERKEWKKEWRMKVCIQ
jgi:hypothetical protein